MLIELPMTKAYHRMGKDLKTAVRHLRQRFTEQQEACLPGLHSVEIRHYVSSHIRGENEP